MTRQLSYISQQTRRAKSLMLTEEGVRRAQEMVESLRDLAGCWMPGLWELCKFWLDFAPRFE